jgi:protein-S-isoprenylcysteine O-methyltransferase Ste14
MIAITGWLGGSAFVASLGYFAYTYAVTLGRSDADGNVARAVIVDVLLFVLFAAHHSLFARPWVKRRVLHLVPRELERSFFVWVASFLLMLVCAAWQPVPGTLYAQHGWLRLVHLGVVAAGMALTALGAARLEPLELAGIDQARHKPRAGPVALVTAFPYSLVRHPIYLGWALMVFGVPQMTTSRLVMASVSTAYLAMAVPWEERLLVREFGAAYREYSRRVRWRMIPGVY